MSKKSTPKIENKKILDKMADNTFEKKCKKLSSLVGFCKLINQISSKKETKLNLYEYLEALTGFLDLKKFYILEELK